MSKHFIVKTPSSGAVSPAGSYVVVTCPKCGKKTYGVAGQKEKKCPVCRRQFPMPDGGDIPRFRTPAEAGRFIQAEEAKRAGRLDFVPVIGGFRPAAASPTVARTNKVISGAKTLDAQFLTWARQYFPATGGSGSAGIPATVVIAAATKAGFAGADKLVDKAVTLGFLNRPKPYLVCLARFDY